jgi:hypothetical protein
LLRRVRGEKVKKHDNSESGHRKVLPCVFFDDVLCSFRRSEKSGIMRRCLGCEHYKKFVEEMEKEEDEFFDEVERARRRGYY